VHGVGRDWAGAPPNRVSTHEVRLGPSSIRGIGHCLIHPMQEAGTRGRLVRVERMEGLSESIVPTP
jgi:hypothetical protein